MRNPIGTPETSDLAHMFLEPGTCLPAKQVKDRKLMLMRVGATATTY